MFKNLVSGLIATMSLSGLLYVTRISVLIEHILQTHGISYSLTFPACLFILFVPVFLNNAKRNRLPGVLTAIGLGYLAGLISLLLIGLVSHRLLFSAGSLGAMLIAPVVLLSWMQGLLLLLIFDFISERKKSVLE